MVCTALRRHLIQKPSDCSHQTSCLSQLLCAVRSQAMGPSIYLLAIRLAVGGRLNAHCKLILFALIPQTRAEEVATAG